MSSNNSVVVVVE
jgi:hypothetical protein